MPNNNRSRLIPAAFGCALLTGLAVSSVAVARDLTFASYLPPQHPTSEGITTFIDKARERSNGSIDFKFFPSGAAAAAKGMLSAVTDGMIDGGFLVTVYFPTSVPANTTISDLSFWNQDSLVATAATVDTILNDCPQCLGEYESHNVRFLASYATPPYQAMCKDEFASGFEPEGMRMRVAGEEIGKWVSGIGGVPVNIPNSESYEAMERSQLDCVIGATSWLKSLSLIEVANSVVELPMGSFLGGSVLNIRESVWQEMSDREQQALIEAAPIGLARIIYAYQGEENEVKKLARDEGVNFVEVSDAMTQQREEFMQSQLARAAETATGRGVENAGQIVAGFTKNLEKWEKLLAGKSLSEAQYAELLKTEIYDKAF
ncbi:C4-dicarboxylate TRAP transporter substrate-binding protein [Marinobacter caseinilyticus]|uniref:C4-dicarboxylate TRAP transporter substrate-binding protein n=1 Tax=Marinobacter caseinilyticus TaxID=2692195 RepID=UPI00140ACA7A|nr:C4-dicarboxylate TRAP transporter substrate-binding protein [Marinobacter caseinilyticus]